MPFLVLCFLNGQAGLSAQQAAEIIGGTTLNGGQVNDMCLSFMEDQDHISSGFHHHKDLFVGIITFTDLGIAVVTILPEQPLTLAHFSRELPQSEGTIDLILPDKVCGKTDHHTATGDLHPAGLTGRQQDHRRPQRSNR